MLSVQSCLVAGKYKGLYLMRKRLTKDTQCIRQPPILGQNDLLQVFFIRHRKFRPTGGSSSNAADRELLGFAGLDHTNNLTAHYFVDLDRRNVASSICEARELIVLFGWEVCIPLNQPLIAGSSDKYLASRSTSPSLREEPLGADARSSLNVSPGMISPVGRLARTTF